MIPARWLVLLVSRPADEEECVLLAEALLEVGGRAVWDEGHRLVTHLLPASVSGAEQVVERLRWLTGRPDLEVDTSWQEHEDWAESWKRGLAPRRVSPRLVVAPSWEVPSVPAGVALVVLDPGVAFGNAEHGTTRGCLRLLDGVLQGGGSGCWT